MGFGWLGTFRQGQWQEFRTFVLNERRDVSRRLAVIKAELDRIGEVSIAYRSTTDEATGETSITEERIGFTVTGGSLEKLVRAYVAQGGNPFNISMFLAPDSTLLLNEDDEAETPTQPGGGVVHPKSGTYAMGAPYEGGRLNLKKDPANKGLENETDDSSVAEAVGLARRWVNQTIATRLHDIEARIIKLMDLREQLLQEQEMLRLALGGTSGAVPSVNQDLFTPDMGVAKVVASIDSVFYQIGSDGVTPDFSTQNTEVMAKVPSLMLDVVPDDDNTAL